MDYNIGDNLVSKCAISDIEIEKCPHCKKPHTSRKCLKKMAYLK